MNVKICATGDLMLLEKFPGGYDCGPIADIINRCDIKITNLESVVSDWDCHASTFCGGQWINSEPEILEDVRKYGFNLYGCANNHAMDYSFDGLMSTKRELEKRNMAFAGIGGSLSESSRAVIYELPGKGVKAAFLSVTSTFIDAARAGDGRDGIPSRPGINPLRINTKYLVTEEHYAQLKDIAAKTYINGERDNARKIGSLPPEEEGSINFGGHFFCVSDDGREGKFTYCHAGDLKRITDEIRRVRELADYVIVSVHSHQIRGTSYSEPDYFLEEFAHKCVDAGADAIVGGGTHQLKPVEIYKNKPIFYSLGNFVFQGCKIKKLPADFWDKYNYPTELSVREGMAIKTKNGTVGLELDRNNYLSVVPIMEFDGGRLVGLELCPIGLGFDRGEELKGLPFLAEKDEADRILDTLKNISSSYGTAFDVRDNISVII